MKQLITILLCLFTLFAEAQVNTNDTNKYFKSYDYGFSYKRLQAREAFIFPTDTVINKLGAVSLNGAIYLGNGTKWTSIGGGSGTTPTLQQVTIAGATSTNAITIPSLNLVSNAEYLNINRNGDGSFVVQNATNTEMFKVNDGVNGFLKFGGGTGQYVEIATSPGGNVSLQVPQASGTIPLSVNGNTADVNGNITIPTIDTTSLSSRINLKIDSLNRSSDSVYAYKNGTRIFQYKDSVGGNDTAKVLIAQVHNATATTLLRGEVVYLFGSTGNVASVKRANNKQDSTSSKTFGIIRSDIPAGGNGFVTTQGQIEKLNLGSYAEGDVLWLDSLDGQFTKVKPQAPYHGVFIGIVERANNGNGLAYIKPQNGVELDEVHDVQINNLINNQIIVYSDTQKVWKNRSIYSVVDTVNTIATKSNVELKLNAADTASLSNRISNEVSNLDILQLLSYGIKAESYGITLANMSSQQGLTTNRFYLYPFNWNVSDTLKNVAWFNRAAISTTPVNYNGIAIYSLSGGTLTRIVQTANDGTFWNSTINTWTVRSITPTYLTKGIYFIGYQFSGSGIPTIGAGAPLVIASTQSPSDPPNTSTLNPNGVKFSTFIANTTSNAPTSIAMSATTAVVNVPYFLFF